MVVSARRKMAIARSSIKPGKGVIKINKMSLNALDNPYIKTLIAEPLKIANDYVSQVDIDVDVRGGGQMGQAQAARAAIAKALVAYTKDSQLKKEMLAYDRFMLVDDVRQVEPKKFKGRKARARFQKSYR
ncbi:MAG: 30S ribosomal protein S9 [Candidatus Micrarchaeota archaeon]|nr:30S ribosomal protein S9 [Candidatus Micrarchaeota archaeon]